MKAFEIINSASETRVKAIILFLWEEERDTYRNIMFAIAQDKKLRPEFVQKKPREEQAEWIARSLKSKKHDQYAEHFIQLWLMNDCQDLLVAFLDGLGLEHDGKGSLEEIPKKLPAKKLTSTVDKLLEKYDDDVVSIYLRIFNLQKNEGYPEIIKLLESEKRLHLA